MAQFKDKYRFSVIENEANYTILFSTVISDFYVIEHSMTIDVFRSFMTEWDGQSFESSDMTVKNKTDGYKQIAIPNNEVRHVYSLSPSDFTRWYALMKQAVQSVQIIAEDEE